MKNISKILVAVIFMWNLSSVYAQDKPTHKNLISGYAFTNLEKSENGDAQFEVGFNPIFLWSINDNILFESELEFELEEGQTNIALEYAQILYRVNPYITLGVGKFLSPTNIFAERFHPAWINKLPTMPLGFSGHGGVQIISGTQVGAQLRGGIPAGSMKIVYSAYVSNGPALNIEEEEVAPTAPALNTGLGNIYNEGGHEEGGHGNAHTGTLNFNNIPDNNGNKAVGGRIGFIPFPELEIGVGFESAKVGAKDTEFEDLSAVTNVVDLSYVSDVRFLAGRIDIKGQAVWLNVDNPNTEQLNFDNKSNAYYAQLAYQPYNVKNEFLQNFEFVIRYDKIDLPEGSEFNTDQNRITAGLNYWLNHSSVLKFAYETITSTHEDGDETENGIILQMSMGF